jgi:hypothetical protein
MSGKEHENDAVLADELLRRLPTTAVPAGLEARILADFDRIAARCAPGALMRLALRWRDRVWPGAPVWQPASLLALSLAVGLIAGALVPAAGVSASTTSDQVFASDDAAPAMDLDKDL